MNLKKYKEKHKKEQEEYWQDYINYIDKKLKRTHEELIKTKVISKDDFI